MLTIVYYVSFTCTCIRKKTDGKNKCNGKKPIKYLRWSVLRKQLRAFSGWLFSQNASSQIFDRILYKPLEAVSQNFSEKETTSNFSNVPDNVHGDTSFRKKDSTQGILWEFLKFLEQLSLKVPRNICTPSKLYLGNQICHQNQL